MWAIFIPRLNEASLGWPRVPFFFFFFFFFFFSVLHWLVESAGSLRTGSRGPKDSARPSPSPGSPGLPVRDGCSCVKYSRQPRQKSAVFPFSLASRGRPCCCEACGSSKRCRLPADGAHRHCLSSHAGRTTLLSQDSPPNCKFF